jgi:hypothetical protein
MGKGFPLLDKIQRKIFPSVTIIIGLSWALPNSRSITVSVISVRYFIKTRRSEMERVNYTVDLCRTWKKICKKFMCLGASKARRNIPSAILSKNGASRGIWGVRY